MPHAAFRGSARAPNVSLSEGVRGKDLSLRIGPPCQEKNAVILLFGTRLLSALGIAVVLPVLPRIAGKLSPVRNPSRMGSGQFHHWPKPS